MSGPDKGGCVDSRESGSPIDGEVASHRRTGTEAPWRLRSALQYAWHVATRTTRIIAALAGAAVLLVFVILFLNFGVLSTPEARAYRNLDPTMPDCREGLEAGWTILSEVGQPAQQTAASDSDGWRDPTNNENVLRDDPPWQTRLRCALQRHLIPSIRG